jgi:hypothetical protein
VHANYELIFCGHQSVLMDILLLVLGRVAALLKPKIRTHVSSRIVDRYGSVTDRRMSYVTIDSTLTTYPDLPVAKNYATCHFIVAFTFAQRIQYAL